MSSGGEKTEQPTEKRLRDARRKGQVSRSNDLSSALLLVVSIAVLGLAGSYMSGKLSEAMRDGVQQAAAFEGVLDRATAFNLLLAATGTIGLTLAPLFAALVLGALLVNYLQVGSIFAPEALKPNLAKLNPAQNFKEKFFKSRPYIELAKTLLKIAITGVVVGSVLWRVRADIIELTSASVAAVAALSASLVFEIGLKVGLTFFLIGAGDYFLQKFLHLREMRMTKHEVKEEYKETEGNPLIKNVRRQIHYEILAQSMKAAVEKADVVVVNPTHVAVALRYDRANMNAPMMVAKGAELMAAQIRHIAEDHHVPIMRDVPLARALYELEVDEEIHEDLYEAVAEVLRWVYELAAERGEVAH